MKRTSLAHDPCPQCAPPARVKTATSILAASVLAASLACASAAHADLIQSETLDPTTLANLVMDPSAGNVTINSVSVVGVDGQIATFTNGLSVPGFLDFDGGLVLSSGTVAAIVGPNSADGTGTNVVSTADGDADFDALTDSTLGTFDAAYIVIDFTPSGDTITGNFVFASEEYNEYAPPDGALSSGNQYYDVMAFFVNGTNYSVTADGDDVSINSVNQTLNAADFIDNDFGDYQPAATPFNIAPDGFTRTLNWTAPVLPGQSNILKFGVADGGDATYDSWLLVEKYSFRVFNAPVDVDLALALSDNGPEVVAGEPLELAAVVDNVGAATASRLIQVDFDLPVGVTVNAGLAASVAETGAQADEWTCQSTDTVPQQVSCFSVTQLYNTPGNSQSAFGFLTDPVDASLTGTTLVTDAVLSSTDNDINGTNDLASESTLVVASDTLAPGVLITGLPAVTGSLSPIGVTLSFNEDVTPMSLGGLDVINGTASNLIIVDARTVTLAITPDGLGDISLSVLAGAVQDNAGNDNLAAGPVTTVFDASSPVLTIGNVPAGAIGSAPFTLNLDFSEAVTGFDANDVSIANGFLDAFVMLDADSWQLTITPDGSNDITVSVPAGAAQSQASGTNSGAASVTIDFNEGAPVASLTSSVPSGNTTGNYTVTIHWSELVNDFQISDLAISNGSLSNLSPLTSPGQVYTVDVTPLGDGPVTVSVLESAVTDAGGLTNPASVTLTTVMDTTPPADPVQTLVLGAASDTGSSSTDAITRLSTVNAGVPAGTATAGDTATLIQDGVALGSVPVAADGSFTFIGITLVEGINSLRYTLSDAVGNTSGEAPVLSVTLDTFVPTVTTEPMPLAQLANLAAYPVSGTCSAIGGTVEISVPAATPASVVLPCSSPGIWSTSLDVSAIADGVDSVQVSATHSDIAGNSAMAGTVAANKDSTAPTITIQTIAGDDTLNALEFNSALLIAGVTSDIADGQSVSVVVNGQGYTTTVFGNTFSVNVPVVDVQQFALTEQVNADVVTALGLAAPTATRTLTVDSLPPAEPVVNPVLTNSGNPVLAGTATLDAGDQLSVTVAGVTYVVGDGHLQIDPSGNWTLTLPVGVTLAEGSNEIIATVTDAAGNDSIDASTQELILDTQPPNVSIDAPPLATVDNRQTFAVSGDCTVGDGPVDVAVAGAAPAALSAVCTPEGRYTASVDVSAIVDGVDVILISAVQLDAAGNASVPATAMANKDLSSPQISILPVAGDDRVNAVEAMADLTLAGTVQDIQDGQPVQLQAHGVNYTATVSAGQWTLTIPFVDIQAWNPTETLTADSSTLAGLAAEQTTRTILIDLQAPASPGIDSQVTAQTSPVIQGTAQLSPGDELEVIVNGVSYLLSAGDIIEDGLGGWTLAIPVLNALGDGVYPIVVNHTDAFGNLASTPVADALTIDASAPGTPIIAPALLSQSDSGSSASDAITRIAQPLFNVPPSTANAGELVTLYADGNAVGNTTVASDGSFQLAPSADLADGVHSMSYTLSDALGNTSGASPATSIVIDTVAEAAGVSTPIMGDDRINQPEANVVTISGLAEADATVDVSISDGVSQPLIQQVQTNSSGQWSWSDVDFTALSDGNLQISAVATDLAGNVASSPVVAVDKDTLAPSTPTVVAQVTNVPTPQLSGLALLLPGETLLLQVNAIQYVLGDGNLSIDADGLWTLQLPGSDSLLAGNYEVLAEAQDAAGNRASDTSEFELIIDLSGPLLSLDPAPAVTTSNQASYQVAGGCTLGDGAVQVSITGAAPASQSASCQSDGRFVATFDVSTIVDGTDVVVIDASQQDAAGNIGTAPTQLADKNTTVPSVSISSIAGDDVINASEFGVDLTISGSSNVIETGQTVTLTVNGADYLASVQAGAWSLIIPQADVALFDSTETFTANVANLAGISAPEATREVQLAITLPPLPSVTSLQTNVPLATISGSAVLNGTDVLSVLLDGVLYTAGDGYLTVEPDDTWSLSLPAGSELPDGVYDVQVSVTDTAGNISSVPGISALVIDTQAPATPGLALDLTASSDSGASDSDDITQQAAPVVQLPAGTVPANALITLQVDGVSVTSMPAQADGSFQSTLASLADDTYSITYRVSDAAGNQSDASPALLLTIDTVAAVASINTPIMGDDAIDAAESSAVILDGSAEPNAELLVHFEDDAGDVIEVATSADGAGNWSLSGAPVDLQSLQAGDLRASVSSIDVAGNQSLSGMFYTPFYPQVPPTPTVDALLSNQTLPVLTGTAMVGPGLSLTVEVDGVPYLLGQGALALAPGNRWLLTLPVGSEVSEGVYDIIATLADAGGNLAVDGSNGELTIDLTPPAQPQVNAQITNAAEVVLSGTALLQPGDTLEITVNGKTYPIGDPALVVDVAGQWTLTLAGENVLVSGIYEVEAAVIDAAGNASVDDSSVELIVDREPPPTPVVSDLISASATPVISGFAVRDLSDALSVLLDGVTYSEGAGLVFDLDDGWQLTVQSDDALADGQYEVQATLIDAAGNVSIDTGVLELTVDTTAPATPSVSALTTRDDTPQLSGTAVLGSDETLTVTLAGQSYTLADTALSLPDASSWQLQVPALAALPDGSYDVVVRITDAAGNASVDVTSDELVVDTQAPAIPQVQSLISASDQPTLTGTATLVSGERLEVSLDGTTYSVGDDLQVDIAGAWTLIVPPAAALDDGSYEVLASITDLAGNIAVDATALELVIDTLAPDVPSVTALVTSNTNPQLTGAAELAAGDILQVTVNGDSYTLADTALVIDALGNWTLDLSAAAALNDGVYAVSVSVTDLAGNVSIEPGNDVLVVDTTAPQSPTVDTQLTNAASPVITGLVQLAAGDSLRVDVDGQSYLSGGLVNISAEGIWTLVLPPESNLTDGVYDVTATVSDAAGNTAVDSSVDELQIDRTAPLIDMAVISDDDWLNATEQQSPVIISGTTNAEDGNLVSITAGDFSASASVATGSWQVSVPVLELQAMSGTVSVVAHVSDQAGNISLPAIRSLQIDASAPVLSLDALSGVNSQNASILPIAGTCDVAAGDVTLVVPGAEPESQLLACVEGRYASTVDVRDVVDGSATVQISISQSDIAGNTGVLGPIGLDKDTEAPVISIISLSDGGDGILNATEAAALSVLGDVQNGAAGDLVTLSIGDGTDVITVTTVLDSDLAWNVDSLDVGGLSDGLLDIVADISDAAGNPAIPATRTVTLSTVSPTLSAVIQSAAWDATPLFAGSSNQSNGTLVQLRTDTDVLLCTAVTINGAWQCETLNALSDGSYSVVASVVDVLGNPASVPLALLVDSLMDSDGDGLLDSVEGDVDTDGDGLVNRLDQDADNDGISDAVEALADPDADGVPAYLDLDADDDGIPDAVEGALDTDGDGLANYLDTDADDDGLADALEAGPVVTEPRDADGDASPDYLDTDSDDDGISDTDEGSMDSDADGLADFIDTDSDGDGIPDELEGNADTDGDGVPDRLDIDSDADGISDTLEAGALPAIPLDTDGDGVPDYRDLDSDDDGISDSQEGAADSDADGVPDSRDSDSNGDGISDELAGSGDTDGDGLADYLDGDIDGDGIGNTAEGSNDSDGDTLPNYLDTDADGDGLSDALETSVDSDGDAMPDFLDTDSDNDGLLDAVEVGSDSSAPVDSDADGIPDYRDTDSDNDAIADAIEGGADSDGDNIANYLDTDSDDDGLPDGNEGHVDADGDGLANYLDTDSDNDGLGDALESELDTDGDGLANYLDLDSDGDTIADALEGSGDYDGDGIANYLDTDSDGDLIPDVVEVRLQVDPGSATGELLAADSDADGSPDFLDTDSDGDLLADTVEAGPEPGNPVDTDGDALPDYIDTDSDNDGLLDAEEGNLDSDGDGVPNVLDSDANNDGIPDDVAGSGDLDGDGTPNFLDADIDGDGIANAVEGLDDEDGDGLPNYADLDSDADGIDDLTEGNLDTDGDGQSDFLDADSDGDGISDALETAADPDGDGVANYRDGDSDGDGIGDSVETAADTDGDAIPDYLDSDSDGDGLTDAAEGTIDSDADGIANYADTDSDDDGITDAQEGAQDSDLDGLADYLDVDSDNDSITDAIEGLTDTDGDSIPDYLDHDSDDDGIADALELANDSDGDGQADFRDIDADDDGLDDALEGDIDTDADGVPDYLDVDADGDGITDELEGNIDSDEDGVPNYRDSDSDADGINDSVEAGLDTDEDGIPDYLDHDSDGDGVPDAIEGSLDSDGDGVPDARDQDSNGDGILDVLVGVDDTDGDGLVDRLDDDIDDDGIANSVEGTVDTDGDSLPDFLDADSDNDLISDSDEGAVDTDADGIPDFQDLDSDGDGIADLAESAVDSDSDGLGDYIDTDSDGDGIGDAIEGVIDTDEDGIPNYLDLSSDFDGIPDALEGGDDLDGDGVINAIDMDADGDGINDDVEAGADTSAPLDTDGDGIPDFLDTDSDDDGLSDADEGSDDSDGDGLADSLDRDSNNDGIPDAVVGQGDTDGDGVSDLLDADIDGDGIDNISEGQNDTDGDGIADFLDTDSDGDGIDDALEGSSDADGDGIVNYLDVDADNDGLPDSIEGAADTDGDGIPNYLDADSDGDGIADVTEGALDTDGDGVANYVDLDSDADGISDADEGQLDLDGDETPNYLDTDSDNDGIADAAEGSADTDFDGTPNFMDTDSDADGIDDAIERDIDSDLDGQADFIDSDSDDDGIPDVIEGAGDSDADGIADFIDTDADGDGIPDAIEGANDFDTDGQPDYLDLDSDNDTIEDRLESAVDTDGDGLPDYLDIDADGDSTPDAIEGSSDANGNGVPDFQEVGGGIDSDNDGLVDALEGQGDRDGDGVPDFLDSDSDADGIPDSVEGAADSDSDGTLDFLDLDSDGDSLPDAEEGQRDSDGDSLPDYLDVDSDDDGISDRLESARDADGDGIGNALDLDSDNDGLSDQMEGAVDTDGDGVRDALDLDSDNDGLTDRLESRQVVTVQGRRAIGELLQSAFDNDGDGIADFRDIDSDNDSITDTIEANGSDVNQDGRIDDFFDGNGNGLHDPVEQLPLPVPDTDTDGLVDFRDIDSDQDGLPDLIEVNGEDEDRDGRLDAFSDMNRDGLDDAVLSVPAVLFDSDGDSHYDFRDTDSDNDGVSDLVEAGGSDADNDGVVDSLADSDADGIPDVVDVDNTGGSDADNDGIDDSADTDYVSGSDSDFDGIVDARDPDANGDGFADASQWQLAAALPDSDRDSVPDFQQALKTGTVKTALYGNGVGCSVVTFGSGSQRTDGLLWLLCVLAMLTLLQKRINRALLIEALAMLTRFPNRLRRVLMFVSLLSVLSACSVLPFNKSSAPDNATGQEQISSVRVKQQQREQYRYDPPQKRFYAGLGVGASMLAPNTDDTELQLDNGAGMAANVHLGMDFSSRLSAEFHAGSMGSATLAQQDPALNTDVDIGVDYGGFAASALFYSAGNRAAMSRRQGLMGYLRAGLGMLSTSGTGTEVEQLNSIQLLLGVGAEFGLKNGLAIRGELLSFDADARALQLGLLYRFGRRQADDSVIAATTQADHRAQAEAPAVVKATEKDANADAARKAQVRAKVKEEKNAKAEAARKSQVQAQAKGTTRAATTPVVAPAAIKVPARPGSTDSDNDGVPNHADACANTEPGIPVDDFGCAFFNGAVSGLAFIGNTAQLTSSSKLELDRISEKLRQYPRLRVQIATHTDDTLSPSEANKLTRNQAITIARYLVGKGIDGARLSARAFGSTRPLVPNTSAVRQKRNRRVEILPTAIR